MDYSRPIKYLCSLIGLLTVNQPKSIVGLLHSKNYKDFFLGMWMRGLDTKGAKLPSIPTLSSWNKKGQMVIFIIIALVIVALVILFLLFRPNVPFIGGGDVNPNVYLRDCIEPDVRPAIKLLGDQGSYQTPEGTVKYQGQEFKYLCYTDDYYETCVVQQPMTKRNFERELNLMLRGKANQCYRGLVDEYESRGYEVSSGGVNSEVSVVPEKVIISYNAPLTIEKSGTVRNFQSFDIEVESEMYDLLFIAQSISDSEASLGDSATELYIQYYPDLIIDKRRLSDGTKIYILTNVITKEEFRFASRSLAWPAGYGLEEIG